MFWSRLTSEKVAKWGAQKHTGKLLRVIARRPKHRTPTEERDAQFLAVELLSEIGDREIVHGLLSEMAAVRTRPTGHWSGWEEALFKALTTRRSPADTAVLMAYIDPQNVQVPSEIRICAVKAMGAHGDPRAIPAISRLLDVSRPIGTDMTHECMNSLGLTGDPSVFDALVQTWDAGLQANKGSYTRFLSGGGGTNGAFIIESTVDNLTCWLADALVKIRHQDSPSTLLRILRGYHAACAQYVTWPSKGQTAILATLKKLDGVDKSDLLSAEHIVKDISSRQRR